MSHDRWLETGGLDLTAKAHEKVVELLAGHQAPPISVELAARLDAIVAAG
jgi:trimethylamine:corrinoid methyltransferase-like protein